MVRRRTAEHEAMLTYDLYTLLKEELKNGSNNLVTRQTGQTMRDRLERNLSREPQGIVIAMDFSRIGVIDYSCADEIVAKLVSRLWGNEYGEKYLLLTGLNENQRENIEVALERKSLAALGEKRENGRILMGNLNNYLVETFNFISAKGSITASELSDSLKLPANTSGTRLLNLHKKRLVRRTSENRGEGRVWVYEAL
jgi:hypothetical protein